MSWFDRVRRRMAPGASGAPEIERAVALFEQGRIEDAESICARVLAHAPANAHALHLLGLAADQALSTEALICALAMPAARAHPRSRRPASG